ncbi:MAG: hypothetical protein DUD39_07545 [Coriobacteriaceae bacterium]|nr:MAG: hypothetical protein DUD39_07545 [Coriobacteriaceae bacterium]
MLMAYDVRSGMPLLSRMYKGGDTDAVFVRELFRQAHLAGMLFLADRGFLSEENLALFTSDGQPVRDRAPQERQALQGIRRPRGEGGLPGALRLDGRRALHFCDLLQQAQIQESYLRHMEMGTSGYTQERLDAMLPYMGVTLLQTSLGAGRSAQDIWSLYKRR